MTNASPEIVEAVTERSAELEETKTELQELITAVDDYQTRVHNLSNTERDLFYEGVSELRERVSGATEPAALLEIREELDEAVRSPLQQLAQDALGALLEQLDPALSTDDHDDVVDALESKDPAALETITATYQDLTEHTAELDSVCLEMLAEAIEAEPTTLQRPQDELVPLAERLATRQAVLTKINSRVADSDWAPAVDLTRNPEFHRDDPTDVDPATIKTHLASIGDGLTSLDRNGIDMHAVLRARVREAVDSGELTELADTLAEDAQTIPAAANTYAEAAEFVTTLEATERPPAAFDAELAVVEQSHDDLRTHDYNTVEYLTQQLDELTTDIDAFVDRLHGRLRAQLELIDELDLATDDTGKPDLRLDLPPSPSAVRATPDDALADYATVQEWLRANLDTDGQAVDQTEMIKLWQSLAEGEAIDLTHANQDVVCTLADKLSLQVVLTS